MKPEDIYNSDDVTKMAFLKEHNYDAFIRVLYKSIESFPDRIKADPYLRDAKVSALYKVIEYFKQDDIQEFEKCALIQKIIDELDKDDISSSSK